MQCLQCQHENRDSARFCEACGSLLALHCLSCTHIVHDSATFCDQCGLQLRTSRLTSLKTHPITPETTPTSAPVISHAERRQLTVMFCDLAASTQLAGQLDPEDLRDIMRDYQSTSGVVIERFEGYIAQYLGDGLLVYFGWPQAHEDDPQRAVHTALGIIEAIGALNTRLEADYGVQLAVRLGIHTGLVVVGEIGTGDRHENLALGETPNIAARLENLAQSNTAVMSAATFRLIQGFFDCDLLGEDDLKGVSQPLVAYRALHASEAQSRLDAVGSRGLTPLVGRQGEMDQLIEGWRQTQRGLGQVLLIQGEAGLGKSRLLQTLKDQLTHTAYTQLECRSTPYYQNTALYPVIDLFQRMLQWASDASVETRLAKLEQFVAQTRLEAQETVPLLGVLLSMSVPEDRYGCLNLSPPHQRRKILETIVAMLLPWAEHQPLLFIVEDLH